MPNEKPGDHPLSDILVHGREVYGPETDELIRGISEFSSKYELYEWWNKEVKGTTDRDEVAQGPGSFSGTFSAVEYERLEKHVIGLGSHCHIGRMWHGPYRDLRFSLVR